MDIPQFLDQVQLLADSVFDGAGLSTQFLLAAVQKTPTEIRCRIHGRSASENEDRQEHVFALGSAAWPEIEEDPFILTEHFGPKDETERRVLTYALAQMRHGNDNVYCCSTPIMLAQEKYYALFKLKREAYEAVGRVVQPGKRSGKIRSFLEAILIVLLEEMADLPASGQARIRQANEIRQVGARLLMTSLGIDGTGLDLFQICNETSTMNYEDLESTGTLLFYPKDNAPPDLLIRLKHPVPVRNLRGLRKLLEVSSPELKLICIGQNAYGFDNNLDDNEPLFQIGFERHGVWKLFYANQALMRVAYGQPALPVPKVDETRFKSHLRQIFPDITSTSTETLWQILLVAAEQKRGTNILITNRAAEEVKRLSNQCTVIDPVKLTPSLTRQVTGIDGTVIVDPEGVCHAIGAILDGGASKGGDRARGGRYNSAVMYYESSPHPCMIIVVSQDGDICFVPSPVG